MADEPQSNLPNLTPMSITVPFVPDMTEIDRALDKLEERVDKIAEKLKGVASKTDPTGVVEQAAKDGRTLSMAEVLQMIGGGATEKDVFGGSQETNSKLDVLISSLEEIRGYLLTRRDAV